jgi:hypothetical protein
MTYTPVSDNEGIGATSFGLSAHAGIPAPPVNSSYQMVRSMLTALWWRVVSVICLLGAAMFGFLMPAHAETTVVFDEAGSRAWRKIHCEGYPPARDPACVGWEMTFNQVQSDFAGRFASDTDCHRITLIAFHRERTQDAEKAAAYSVYVMFLPGEPEQCWGVLDAHRSLLMTGTGPLSGIVHQLCRAISGRGGRIGP